MKNIRSHSIFWGLAATGIFLLIIFSYLAQRALKVEGTPPAEALVKFYKFNRYLTFGNIIIYILLLFVSTIIYIRQRYWDTFIWTGIIFVIFTLVDWWWLSNLAFHYRKAHNYLPGESNLYPIVGIFICLAGLGITIGNYLLLKKMIKEKKIDPLDAAITSPENQKINDSKPPL